MKNNTMTLILQTIEEHPELTYVSVGMLKKMLASHDDITDDDIRSSLLILANVGRLYRRNGVFYVAPYVKKFTYIAT